MKKFLTILVAVGIAIALAGGASAKDLKIGYVDVMKVFDEYKKTKEYDKTLEVQKTAEEKKLEAKKNEIEAAQKKLDVLKDKDAEKAKENLGKMISEYRTLEKDVYMSLKQQRDDKMKEIIEDIDKVIKEYAKKNGYDLILNENTILFGAETMTLTETVLKEVNANYTPASSKK